MKHPHENFTKDYKNVLIEGQQTKITREHIDNMEMGPMKVIASLLFFSIGPNEIAQARIPRSKSGIYEWIRRYVRENG
jgi:hypothetical protein